MPSTHRLPALMLLAVLPVALAACSRSEAPATAAPAAPAAAATAGTPEPSLPAFDLAAVPLSEAALPPFPYLPWPAGVPAEAQRPVRQEARAGLTLVTGPALRLVEGQFEHRVFSLPAGTGAADLRRDVAARITALGGHAVPGLAPVNTDNATIAPAVQALAGPGADVAKLLGLERYDEGQYVYEVYVVRSAAVTAWFVVQTSQYSAALTVVAEPVAPAVEGQSTPT